MSICFGQDFLGQVDIWFHLPDVQVMKKFISWKLLFSNYVVVWFQNLWLIDDLMRNTVTLALCRCLQKAACWALDQWTGGGNYFWKFLSSLSLGGAVTWRERQYRAGEPADARPGEPVGEPGGPFLPCLHTPLTDDEPDRGFARGNLQVGGDWKGVAQ